MADRLLDQVRDGCRQVAEQARFVRIAAERIEAYAASLPLDALAPEYDRRHHYLGPPEATAAFVLTLDAVNFGSGYFPLLRKRPGMSGYFTIASSLKDRFDVAGPFAATDLERLTVADCATIFGQDLDDGAVEELMTLFARALNDLGEWVSRRFAGRFLGPTEEAAGSAERLVELLIEMEHFRDVARYAGLAVPFLKRAQLTAGDLALAFAGEGPGRFGDLDRLTIFADNLVPHVLRVDGLLGYDPALAARIDAGELIPAGSPEEIEIRAGALHAVEVLVAARRARGQLATAMQLDYLLWNRGQAPAYKASPRHRTRTVYY
jgi:hypothetical protein